ncbi:MAG: hypothetical protein ACRETP_06570, partial [Steroidobacteraceae bacterium]
MSPEELATATYRAMCEAPRHVHLARSLLEAEGNTERAVLLDGATCEVREAALAHLAVPEGVRERERRLAWLRADSRRIAAARVYYGAHIADFCADWMTVTDPRRVARGQSAAMSFALFPRQRELVGWLIERFRKGEPGTVVKARDVGASSVCLATLAALAIFEQDFSAGVISSTEAKLDRYVDTLFMKLRGLLRDLPPEFAGGYDEERTSQYLAVTFPASRGSITGGTGPQAFRGGRLSCVLVDEAAHLIDSAAIDSALTSVSDVRIDVSTP